MAKTNHSTIKIANPVARAMGAHSGNAGQGVSIDARPKTIPGRGRNAYRRNDKHRGRCFD